MAALVRDFPGGSVHTVDLPYRLCSWAFDHPENVSLWVNKSQELVGWAVLQTPFWTLDLACRPEVEEHGLPQILAWGDFRARQILNTPQGHPSWSVKVFSTQADRIHTLETFGFVSQANIGEDSWTEVFMQHTGEIPEIHPPKGFVIRPLAGIDEVDAYVELHRSVFESRNMTREWRMRTLDRPEHHPDLDLVAVAPDGRLAAFFIGWMNQEPGGRVEGQIEPIGVHQDFRKMGLGGAILIEGLRRLKLHHAQDIYVITDNYRNAALDLYESAGFRVERDILIYRKNYE
jgi:mycothiol synthase